MDVFFSARIPNDKQITELSNAKRWQQNENEQIEKRKLAQLKRTREEKKRKEFAATRTKKLCRDGTETERKKERVREKWLLSFAVNAVARCSGFSYIYSTFINNCFFTLIFRSLIVHSVCDMFLVQCLMLSVSMSSLPLFILAESHNLAALLMYFSLHIPINYLLFARRFSWQSV